MRKMEGTLVEKKGKFFVQIGEEMHELDPNPLGEAETLKANVGQEVQVVLADPRIVAIITHKVPVACYRACFICYKPRDLFEHWKINPAIKELNLKAFLEEGLITQEVFDQQMKMH